MTPSTKLFSSEDKQRIEDAIEHAERETCAEIVVAVKTSSGRYDRVEDIFGLMLALIVVGVAALVFPSVDPEQWTPSARIDLHPGVIIALFGLTAVGGAALASYRPALVRPFLRKRSMLAAVKTAGVDAFHALQVRRTSGAHGVLIFVSLYEHMVWVVGDDAINEKVTEAQWNSICERLLAGFKTGERTQGVVDAIEMTGALLAEPFPPGDESADELPNTLHLL